MEHLFLLLLILKSLLLGWKSILVSTIMLQNTRGEVAGKHKRQEALKSIPLWKLPSFGGVTSMTCSFFPTMLWSLLMELGLMKSGMLVMWLQHSHRICKYVGFLGMLRWATGKKRLHGHAVSDRRQYDSKPLWSAEEHVDICSFVKFRTPLVRQGALDIISQFFFPLFFPPCEIQKRHQSIRARMRERLLEGTQEKIRRDARQTFRV